MTRNKVMCFYILIYNELLQYKELLNQKFRIWVVSLYLKSKFLCSQL